MKLTKNIRTAKLHAQNLPEGCDVLGLVRMESGAEGALVIDGQGVFYRCCKGEQILLEQQKLLSITVKHWKKGTIYVREVHHIRKSE